MFSTCGQTLRDTREASLSFGQLMKSQRMEGDSSGMNVSHMNSSVGTLVPFMAAFQDSQHAPPRVVLQAVFSVQLADLIQGKALPVLLANVADPHVNQAKGFSLSAVST